MGCGGSKFTPNNQYPGQGQQVLKIGKYLGMTPKNINSFYSRFCKIDENHTQNISMLEFQAVHKDLPEWISPMIYHSADTQRDGLLNFQSFLIGLWNFCTADTKIIAALTFGVFDKDRSGGLTRKEMDDFIESLWSERDRYRFDDAFKRVKRRANSNHGNYHEGKAILLVEFIDMVENSPELLISVVDAQGRFQSYIMRAEEWIRLADYRSSKFPNMNVREIMAGMAAAHEAAAKAAAVPATAAASHAAYEDFVVAPPPRKRSLIDQSENDKEAAQVEQQTEGPTPPSQGGAAGAGAEHHHHQETHHHHHDAHHHHNAHHEKHDGDEKSKRGKNKHKVHASS